MVYQKTVRRPPEDCQKTTRRPLAVFWQSSNTMIQGNFYERLHFYMDSCAISPMASFLAQLSTCSSGAYPTTICKPYTFLIYLQMYCPPGVEKLKSQVNVTFWFWVMYTPYPTPPRNGKVEISGQCDILVLADVPLPPPNMEKLKQVTANSNVPPPQE